MDVLPLKIELAPSTGNIVSCMKCTNLKSKPFRFYFEHQNTDLESFKNFTEEITLLGLPSLYFLPVGSPVGKVGESEFSPHMAGKLI